MKAGIDHVGVTTAFYCNDGNGNFLLHKRSNSCRDERGKWDFGGGKLEFGETLEESALREAEEEYGVRGEIQEQLPAHSAFVEQDGVKTHWVVVTFLIKMDIRKARIMEPEKATALGIFTLDNLPEPLHVTASADLSRYKEYFDGYRKPKK